MKKFIMAMILVLALTASVCLAEAVDSEGFHPGGWAGGWYDGEQDAYLDIVVDEDGTFIVAIVYSDEDGATVYCDMNATYDENADGLVYTNGTKYKVETTEEGIEEELVWEGSSGLLSFTEDDQLLWEDDKEELDSAMVLDRIISDAKMIAPVLYDLDVDNLPDGIYPVAFNRDNLVETEDGLTLNGVMIFTADVYDIVDIATLEAGDSLLWDADVLVVETIEENDDGMVIINGGYENGGCDLRPVEESNCYVVVLYDDYSTYTAYGETDLALAETATFTDSSDIEADPVSADYADIAAAIKDAKIDAFTYNNTTIRVEDGKIVEINRHYVP